MPPASRPKRRTQAPEMSLEERRAKVSELHLRGRSQHEIAVLMGVSQPTVSKDLAALKVEWRESRNGLIDEHIAKSLAKWSLVQQLAFEEFEKSKLPQRTTSTSKESVLRKDKKDDEEETPKGRGRPKKYEKDNEGRLVLIKETIDECLKTGVGDVSFLTLIVSVEEKKLKLIGAMKQDNVVNLDNRQFTFDFTSLYRRPSNDDDIDDVERQIKRIEALSIEHVPQEPPLPVQSTTISDDEVERIMQRALEGTP